MPSPGSLIFPVLLLLLLLISSVPIQSKVESQKLAFLFWGKGLMPLEDIWKEFFTWRADPNLYSIYIHTHKEFRYPEESIFAGHEVDGDVISNLTHPGAIYLRAVIQLLTAALKEPLNQWFFFISDSCIPLMSFSNWYKIMSKNSKSILNACPHGVYGDPDLDTTFGPNLTEVGIPKSYWAGMYGVHWRESAKWFGINRKHAEIFVKEINKQKDNWEQIGCCYETILPTIIAHAGLGTTETTCSDGMAYSRWPSDDALRPTTYSGKSISPKLFNYIQYSVDRAAGSKEPRIEVGINARRRIQSSNYSYYYPSSDCKQRSINRRQNIENYIHNNRTNHNSRRSLAVTFHTMNWYNLDMPKDLMSPYTGVGLNNDPRLASIGRKKTVNGEAPKDTSYMTKCCGYHEVCHFTARKFAPNAKGALMDHLDVILVDDNSKYKKNSNWARDGMIVRLSEDRNSFYLISDGKMRIIPDRTTLQVLGLPTPDAATGKVITALDKEIYPMARPIPSLVDGQAIRVKNDAVIYVMKGGSRRVIASMETFYALGLQLDQVQKISQDDLQLIPLGESIQM